MRVISDNFHLICVAVNLGKLPPARECKHASQRERGQEVCIGREIVMRASSCTRVAPGYKNDLIVSVNGRCGRCCCCHAFVFCDSRSLALHLREGAREGRRPNRAAMMRDHIFHL